MALASRKIPNKWKFEKETSPERTKVWTEPLPKVRVGKKVAVVYYLSRNGQLQQPHFLEIPIASPEGLYLRDVIDRLNQLRGQGMASMYSWSSKRSYRSGFVWHDLAEDDFIYPAQGNEYVLKGSELAEGGALIKESVNQYSSSFRKPSLPESEKSDENSDFPSSSRRRNQSWTSVDFNEYKVYKSDCASGGFVSRAAADASTQTAERRRGRGVVEETEEEKSEENCTDELNREEISPPPSDSSPETLETLMKSDGRVVQCPDDRTLEIQPRFKASSVLMQLISCGSMSLKDCGPTQYKLRLPRGGWNSQVGKGAGEDVVEPSFIGRVKLEDKEYFSGSLVETKKKQVRELGALKRSNSCNADRSSQMGLMEKETKRK